MSLKSLLPLLKTDASLAALRGRVDQLAPGQAVSVPALPSAARVATLATLLTGNQRPALVLTGRLDAAEELAAALAEYLPAERAPLIWPVPEALPYEQVPVDRVASARRVDILIQLLDHQPVVVVAPARALAQPIAPPSELARQRLTIRVGQRLRQDVLIRDLLDQGYELVSLVTEPGQVSRRGGIVDLFLPSGDDAVRIDLFGDEVDALRLFDPETQRSIKSLDAFEALPAFEVTLDRRRKAAEHLRALEDGSLRPEVAEEWARTIRRLEHGDPRTGLDLITPYLLPRPASLLDYLPDDHLLAVVEPTS
ncbi:MAG TPA: transcription-repair coupling factor, partial [Nitrolancea sp.]|nr:transcription-repair coupling factor [Nitrolancea sp.]